MFVASRWVIQGAIRVKVHRIVRDVHMQYSVFFLQPSRAHGPYCTSTSIYIERAYARTLGRWRDEKRRGREKEKEREIERSKKRANDSREEGTIKKKEKKPRMRSCAFYRCSLGETNVGACVRARMYVSCACKCVRTTGEHYLRYACDYVLSRFRLTRKRLLCGSVQGDLNPV